MTWTMAPYDAARHEEAVHALWCDALPSQWTIVRACLARLFPSSADSVVAVDGDRVVGFAGTIPSLGALAALVVDPSFRRRGIGRALFRAAADALRRRAGDRPIVIGGTPFLWNGVPLELEGAVRFFSRLGCVPTERISDQYRPLDDYRYPAELEQQLERRGLRLGLAGPNDAEDVIEFERTCYPAWLELYADALQRGAHDSIGCIRGDKGVLGTVLIRRPGTAMPGEPWGCGEQWAGLAPMNVGAFGVFGIAPLRAGQAPGLVATLRELARSSLSLGYALAAFATRELQRSGSHLCFLNASEAVPLFRRLGFQHWAECQVFEAPLTEAGR
jgi:ribosomal protein S18 acetylase RimI-like enzyme